MSPADRTSLLAQAEQLLKQPNFSRESASKVESLLMLADRVTDHDSLRRATLRSRDIELGRAPQLSEPTSEDQEFRTYLRASDSRMVRELEKRAGMNVGTGSAGGWLAPAGFAQRVELALAAADGIFRASTSFETQRGGAFNYPIIDDETIFATVIAEAATSVTSNVDVAFAAIEFPQIQTWRSGFVSASWEVLQDSSFDFEALLADTFGKRLARGIAKYLIGVLVASAPVGVTAASPTAVTANEVLELLDVLSEDFQPNASWLMRQSTLNAIRELKSSSGGNFMFPAAQTADGQETLMGRRVYASPSMDALTDIGFPVAYGDFSKFVIRRVAGSVAIKAFPERQAEYGRVCYESYLRADGALLAATPPAPIVLLSAQGGS